MDLNLSKILEKDELSALNHVEYTFLHLCSKSVSSTEEKLNSIVDFIFKNLNKHLDYYCYVILIAIRNNPITNEELLLKIKAHQYMETLSKLS